MEVFDSTSVWGLFLIFRCYELCLSLHSSCWHADMYTCPRVWLPVGEYFYIPIFPHILLPLSFSLSISTLSTLIDFTLMFDSFFPAARPPSRCRLPRRFLRSAALASALVLAISYSLSSPTASLIYSLLCCGLPSWFLPFLYGSCHKT